MRLAALLLLGLAVPVACSEEGRPQEPGPSRSSDGWVERYPMLYDPRVMGDDDPEVWARLPFERLLLRREGCYGVCPVYEVELRRGGPSRYTGGAHAPREGEFTGPASLYAYGLLCAAVEDLRLEDLRESYTAGWTDDETVVVEWERDGKTHRVSDYGRRAPPAFQAYRALFDELVDGMSWTPIEESR